jgi:hypothetical protein
MSTYHGFWVFALLLRTAVLLLGGAFCRTSVRKVEWICGDLQWDVGKTIVWH